MFWHKDIKVAGQLCMKYNWKGFSCLPCLLFF